MSKVNNSIILTDRLYVCFTHFNCNEKNLQAVDPADYECY